MEILTEFTVHPWLFVLVGFWNIVLPLALGWLGYEGQRRVAESQNEAARLAAQQATSQKELADYMLRKRREVYDPIETGMILPKLTARAGSPAPWAKQAGFWSRSLAAKMPFRRT